MNEDRIGILDYLYQFAHYKWKIILNFLIVCTLAVGVSYMVPKTYLASATVLPATSDMQSMGISSLLSDIPDIGGLGSLMAGLGSEGTTIVAVLNSRSLKDSLINKFDLMNRYKTVTMIETRKALEKDIGYELTEEGTIKIYSRAKTKYFSFGDKDNEAKNHCYNMAIYILDLLDDMNQKLRAESARNQRQFIESRFLQNKNDLESVADEFRRFQKRTGIISLEEQTKATIQVIAQLKAMIVAKEVEIEQLKQIMSPENTMILNARKELSGLQIKYNHLIEGQVNQTPDLFPAINDLPDLGIEYLRLYRDLTIQEKIQEIIVPMYEQAKIQEAKDTPSLQVIDHVVIPDKKLKPKRAFIVLFAGFTAILASLFFIYLKVNLEYISVHNRDTYDKLQKVAKELSLKK